MKKKPIVQKPEDIPRNKIYTNIPCNINVKYIVDKEKVAENNNEKQEIRFKFIFHILVKFYFSVYNRFRN